MNRIRVGVAAACLSVMVVVSGCIPKPSPCQGKAPICTSATTCDCWKDQNGTCVFVPCKEKFRDMLLRQHLEDGVPVLTKLDGVTRVVPQGAIPCCVDSGIAQPNGWGMASPHWMDLTLPYGFNFYHFRLGPGFSMEALGLAPSPWGWDGIGGAYAESPAGGPCTTAHSCRKADLDTWNAPWWRQGTSWVDYAGQHGVWVEVDIGDGWAFRHGQNGDWAHPWDKRFNVQGEDALSSAGKTIAPRHREWIKKVVSEYGCYGNVIWQDGNEIGTVAGYRKEWTLGMRAAVRQYEQEVGCGFTHLFGSNSQKDEVEFGPVDYVSTHARAPITENPYHKLLQNNERNPNFAGLEAHYKCLAEKVGAHWWYWRAGDDDAAMLRSFEAFKQGCNPEPPIPCPPPHPLTPGGRATCNDNQRGPNITRLDSEFLFGSSMEFCQSIGYTDGRRFCPVRPEGNRERQACEAAFNGDPTWEMIPPTTGEVEPTNPYMYKVSSAYVGTAKVCFPKVHTCGTCEVGP